MDRIHDKILDAMFFHMHFHVFFSWFFSIFFPKILFRLHETEISTKEHFGEQRKNAKKKHVVQRNTIHIVTTSSTVTLNRFIIWFYRSFMRGLDINHEMNCAFCQEKLFEQYMGQIKPLKVATCGHVYHQICFNNAIKK